MVIEASAISTTLVPHIQEKYIHVLLLVMYVSSAIYSFALGLECGQNGPC